MIWHFLKLVWRRKRSNALITAEIFLSFLVVLVVATLAVSLVSRWSRPVGFDWKDVWVIDLDQHAPGSRRRTSSEGQDAARKEAEANIARVDSLLKELRNSPEVEDAAADGMLPYSNGSWTSVVRHNGRRLELERDVATDRFANVMRLKVIRGRWFAPEDEALNFVPVVIDTNAAATLFGSANPLGERLGEPSDDGTPDLRVVGVIEQYRKEGEFTTPGRNMVFSRPSAAAGQLQPSHVVLRVRPGTPASFEAELNSRLHRALPDVSFRVRRMDEARAFFLRTRMAPLIALSVVALFLISMVALGLTGVLWQTVTRRTREIGLRRAVGASAGNVRAQVLAEVALLATLAVSVGLALTVQLPLLGVFRLVTPAELSLGCAAALAVIYAITLACGAYPSWLASRVDPAEALRYE